MWMKFVQHRNTWAPHRELDLLGHGVDKPATPRGELDLGQRNSTGEPRPHSSAPRARPQAGGDGAGE